MHMHARDKICNMIKNIEVYNECSTCVCHGACVSVSVCVKHGRLGNNMHTMQSWKFKRWFLMRACACIGPNPKL